MKVRIADALACLGGGSPLLSLFDPADHGVGEWKITSDDPYPAEAGRRNLDSNCRKTLTFMEKLETMESRKSRKLLGFRRATLCAPGFVEEKRHVRGS